MDESLGWVFAEAALSGMPRFTTIIFAIPDLVVDGVTGWLIKMELDQDRRWLQIGQAEATDAFIGAQAYITTEVTGTLASIEKDRSVLRRFGDRARAHIAKNYGFDVAGPRFDAVYRNGIRGRRIA